MHSWGMHSPGALFNEESVMLQLEDGVRDRGRKGQKWAGRGRGGVKKPVRYRQKEVRHVDRTTGMYSMGIEVPKKKVLVRDTWSQWYSSTLYESKTSCHIGSQVIYVYSCIAYCVDFMESITTDLRDVNTPLPLLNTSALLSPRNWRCSDETEINCTCRASVIGRVQCEATGVSADITHGC